MTERWPKVRLSELVTKVGSGATPNGGSESYAENGIPLIRSMNVRFEGFTPRGLVYLDDNQAAKLSSVEVEAGDVLLNITGASIGRVTVAPTGMNGARVNQHVSIIRCVHGFESGYLHRYLASPTVQREIFETESGATRQALTKAKILNFNIPLPPLNEQRRIVAKIEALQARSEAAKQALDAIGPLLEQFRQSVLGAAFRGDLTASWREQHPDVEPASALLERIRVERKARFIAAAGDKARVKAEAKAHAAGNPWTEADATAVIENARAKAEAQYVEPEPPDLSNGNLNPVPPSWTVASVGEVTDCLDRYRKPITRSERTPGPFPYYGANGEVDRVGEYLFDEDLVLVTEDETFYGRVKPIAYRVSGKCWVNNHAHVLRAVDPVPVDFLWLSLMHYNVEPWLSGTTGRAKLTQGALSVLPLSIAPAEEMRVLAEKVALMLGWAEAVATKVAQATGTMAQLDQSILAKAFRGELVPQDPNDEPASVLLERIRAERASATPRKKPKPQRAAPKPFLESPPTPPPKPAAAPEQLDLLVHVPPERVPVEEEPTEVMAALRKLIGNHAGVPRDAMLRSLAESLGYQRVSPKLRERLDGHLRAAVRRRILEPGHAELLRLATHRVEDYSQEDLAATLRTISRRGCAYEREELARSLLDHLGFRRMTATAKHAITSAIDIAIKSGTFEAVDSERLRRR
jgi:type I restriction enzyme S subunit